MPKPATVPSFAMLVQRFFTEHLANHRAVSPRTVAAYGDTFRLLLQFAERHTGKSPTNLKLVDLDAKFVLAFLDHLERDRKNGARSRNARLAALRSFLKYAAHHDLSALGIIEQVLAVPMKRFDRPMLCFLTRQEMQAILDAPDTATCAGQRDHALFTMLYNTGARVSEIVDLQVKNLILDASPAVHLSGKGRKQRAVPLWRSTVTMMRAWKRCMGEISDSAPLFPNRSGGAMSRSNVTQRLALAVAAAAEQHSQLLTRSIAPQAWQLANSTSSVPRPQSEYDRYQRLQANGSDHLACAAAKAVFDWVFSACAFGAPSGRFVSAPMDASSSPLAP
jgi:integrase/recombinase XerD